MQFFAHTKSPGYLTSIEKETTIIPEVWLCSSHLCVRSVYIQAEIKDCRPISQATKLKNQHWDCRPGAFFIVFFFL